MKQYIIHLKGKTKLLATSKDLCPKQRRTGQSKTAKGKQGGLQEDDEIKKEPQEKYDMYKNEDYVEVTKAGNQVYRDDKFSDSTSIEQASDFTLGVYMMENNVSV